MNFTEGITASMFVNLAILGYMLLKEESAKIFIALSAIFMFVFLVNEHLIANFASFMLLGFNGIRDAVDNFTLANILHQWVIVFFGNWILGSIKPKQLTSIRRLDASKDIYQTNLPSSSTVFYMPNHCSCD